MFFGGIRRSSAELDEIVKKEACGRLQKRAKKRARPFRSVRRSVRRCEQILFGGIRWNSAEEVCGGVTKFCSAEFGGVRRRKCAEA